MAKVANIDPFKNFPEWNPVEKHKNYGQNQKASNMEPFGGNLWHCGVSFLFWGANFFVILIPFVGNRILFLDFD